MHACGVCVHGTVMWQRTLAEGRSQCVGVPTSYAVDQLALSSAYSVQSDSGYIQNYKVRVVYGADIGEFGRKIERIWAELEFLGGFS